MESGSYSVLRACSSSSQSPYFLMSVRIVRSESRSQEEFGPWEETREVWRSEGGAEAFEGALNLLRPSAGRVEGSR
jgi:hypothetical protein